MGEFDDFEEELKQALERRPAPPGLKRKVMERRSVRRVRVSWFGLPHAGMWMKLAAMLVIVAILSGVGLEWRARRAEEQRKGEAARQQVATPSEAEKWFASQPTDSRKERNLRVD